MNDKSDKSIDVKEDGSQSTDALVSDNKRKKPFRWSLLFITVSFLVALTSAAAAAYLWLQFESYKKTSADSLSQSLIQIDNRLEQKLDAQDMSAQIEPVVTPLQKRLVELEQLNALAEQHLTVLTESTKKLFELYGRDKNGWQLAEVEYLLRIAQHRLLIENDFQGAEKTLKAADEKLSEIADPGLLPVRLIISDERVLLQARSRPDLVGIVLSLSRIVKQIPYLKLSPNQSITAPKNDKKEVPNLLAMDAPWQEQVISFVKGLVKVETLKSSISIESVGIVDVLSSLEEKLKLAKWAVLERDASQYHQLIEQSTSLLKQYYDEKNNYHVELYHELVRLNHLEIRPTLPDISHSLLKLKAIMLKKQHTLKTEKPVESISSKQMESVPSKGENENGEANE